MVIDPFGFGVAPAEAPSAADAGRDGLYLRRIKPFLDKTIAALALIALSPLLIATAIALLIALGRPVLFRQERIGRGGQVFTMMKFRTMRPERRHENRAVVMDRRYRYHKNAFDPRHTPLGLILRRLSLDELPQFINVLRGEMSLIGPRPELTHIVAAYLPWQHERHCVSPGLTGLWQLSARDQGHMDEYVGLDIAYARSVGFKTDLSIAWRTLPALLRRVGG